ncbi:MAG TPA: putative toxin-antitoxin system toxin component, PIN family [Thermoanaerobaculia bacterium]
MRAVADTNVVVSGLLWQGPSRRVLDLARTGALELFTPPALLVELEDVLRRRKFRRRLEQAGVDPADLVVGYATLAQVVLPIERPVAIPEDPDDDEVLACALAARAEIIVSGDRHLKKLQSFRGIRIVTAAQVSPELPSSRD